MIAFKLIDSTIAKFEKNLIDRRTASGIIFFSLLQGCLNRYDSVLINTKTGHIFEASEINHIAIRVTDLDKSQEFYEELLGLKLIKEFPNIRFLACAHNFLALFKTADSPGLDHFCFSIPNYDRPEVIKKLKLNKTRFREEMDRIFIEDPDGITLQIASTDEWPIAGTRPKIKL